MKSIKILIKYIFFILLISYIHSQECGDNECDSQSETYINCIDDCPITVENLVWIDDIPVHLDDEDVIVTINMENLEDLFGIIFKIEFDSSVLELDSACGEGTDNSSCAISNQFNSVTYMTNTSTSGEIIGILFSGMEFSIINNEFATIRFNILGSLGDYSEIIINEFIISQSKDTNVIDYSQNGMVTIGNFGCIDQAACNYSSSATFDDGSCEYEYDCLGECGGNAIEDCEGLCNGSSVEDCLGDCNGLAIVDECDQCDGNMFIDPNGFYPDGSCDCEGTQPNIYCIDNDDDGLGNPESSFSSCSDNLSYFPSKYLIIITWNI